MKKFAAILLGMSLILGTATVSFGQEKKEEKKEKKGKKKGEKKAEEKKPA